MRLRFFILLFAGSSLWAAPTYRVIRSVPVPGNGGWDYPACDGVARRLYIAHSTQTQVMDIDQLTMVGAIPHTNGVHDIALAPELGRGFISAGKDNQLVIFNLKTLKPLGTPKTGENPDAIVYEPITELVLAFNGRSHSVTMIEAKTGEVLNTIPLEGKPEFAVADGRGWVFVNLEDKNQLVKINARMMAIERRLPLAPCAAPSGLAMDQGTARLFVGCRNKMMAVVDANKGRVVTALPIGEGVDTTLFDPATKLIFIVNGDGTITVIEEKSPDQYKVVQTVSTMPGARTATLDPMTHRLFVPVAKKNVPGSLQILIVAP